MRVRCKARKKITQQQQRERCLSVNVHHTLRERHRQTFIEAVGKCAYTKVTWCNFSESNVLKIVPNF